MDIGGIVYFGEHLAGSSLGTEVDHILYLVSVSYDGGRAAFSSFAGANIDVIAPLTILPQTVPCKGSKLMPPQACATAEVNESLVPYFREVSIPNGFAP
jgi:hypothetical protein